MELIWLVLSLLVVGLAALLFAVDTRPGFQHAARTRPGLHASAFRFRRRSITG